MDVGQRFRDSEGYELPQSYADGEGLVAGYRIEGLLWRDPWRHTTYEATAPDGRRVALKLLQLHSGESRREARRFRARVRVRAAVEHPHLLPIFDWGRVGDRYYVAMGLCRAPTLADLLAAGPLKPRSSLRLLGQLADALEAAHERGVIHRELAPESVLVAPREGGHVLVGDFGVANPERGSGLLELAEPVDYVPPERLRDEPLTRASNVYSLACILVECLTGSPPYTSGLPGMVAYAHAAEPAPRLSERDPGLPVAIDDLVAAAMAKDPEQRLQSPRRLVAAAAGALGADSALPSAGNREVGETNGSAAAGALGDRAVRPRAPAPRRYSVRKRGLSGRALSAAGGLAARRRTGAWRAAARRRTGGLRAAVARSAFGVALALFLVGSGALGLTLARSGDEREPGRGTAGDQGRLRAQREPTAAIAATSVALERLNARRAIARSRLVSARTARAQAAAAAPLVSEYRAAARALPTDSRDTARAAQTLNEASNAYRRLVAAARRGDRSGYQAARRAVGRSEKDLQHAIARLNRTQR